MDLNLDIRALKQISMWNVVISDNDYIFRKIFRWYSKEFSTPLAEVEDLPLEDVLFHYFEDEYENMDKVDRDEEIAHLLMTPAQLKALRMREDAMDADTLEFGNELEEKEKEEVVPPAQVPTNPIQEKLDKLAAAREAAKLPPPPLPEGIHLTFEDIPDDAPSFGPPAKPMKNG